MDIAVHAALRSERIAVSGRNAVDRFRLNVVLCALAALCTHTAHAPAQSSGGPYRIDEAAIASGGATLGGGTFELSGTVGQPAATTLAATGFRLYDGFWSPATATSELIFANGFDP